RVLYCCRCWLLLFSRMLGRGGSSLWNAVLSNSRADVGLRLSWLGLQRWSYAWRCCRSNLSHAPVSTTNSLTCLRRTHSLMGALVTQPIRCGLTSRLFTSTKNLHTVQCSIRHRVCFWLQARWALGILSGGCG